MGKAILMQMPLVEYLGQVCYLVKTWRDLECMDTHVVNAVLTGSKTKSSLIESVSCSSQIIPDELDLSSGVGERNHKV